MAEETVEKELTPKEQALVDMGLNPEEVETWKQRFGRIELLKIGGKPFVYRSLRRLEWKQLMEQAANADGDALMAQEMAVGKCLVHPREFEIPVSDAGIVATLSDAIMRFSGFGADEEPIEL